MMRVRLLVSTIVLLSIASVAQSQTAYLGSIRNLTNTSSLIVPGDTRDDINFVAVNVYGSSSQIVRGLNFQTDGQLNEPGNVIGGGTLPSIRVSSNNRIDNWDTLPSVPGTDSANLNAMLHDIRYQGVTDGTALTITLNNLSVGKSYRLQTVSVENSTTVRNFDIIWDYGGTNVLAVDEFDTSPLGNRPAAGSATSGGIWDYTFTALNTSMVVGFYRGNFGGANLGGNRDPILQAVILSQVVPEPTSIIGWTLGGLFAVGFVSLQLRRRRPHANV